MIQFPELRPLYDRLLNIGGTHVAPQPEPHLDRILKRGETFDGRGARLELMRVSRCHSNAAQLWGTDPERYRLATGWALSGDGIWRQHSWALEGDRIVETTERRKLYHGFRLTDAEEERFFTSNCEV